MKRIFISLGIVLYGCLVFAFTPKAMNKTQQNEHRLKNRYEMSHILPRYPSLSATEATSRIWKEHIDSYHSLKSPAFQLDAATMKLDSAVTKTSSGVHQIKHVITYNNIGYCISYILYNWDEFDEEWQLTKLDYEYDSAGRMKEQTTSYWDASTSSWMKFSKTTNKYYSNGNIESTASFSWIEALSDWYGTYRNDYFYFSNGKTERVESFSWDMITKNWKILEKITFHYDNKGNNDWSEVTHYDNVNLVWKNQYRYESTYDNSGKETLNTTFNWDETKPGWVGHYRYKSEYNSNGNEVRYTTYAWDEMKPGWIEDDKTEYDYDSNGNLTKYIDYEWDADATKWIDKYKSELKYDNKGNVTELVDYNYNSNIPGWVNDTKNEYTYDNTYTVSSLLASPLTYWTNYNLTQEKRYTANEEGVWDSEHEITNFFYSPFTGTGLSNTLHNNIFVYPNPVKDILHIQYEADTLPDVRLYNLAGQLLLSSRSKLINMTGYAQGMYIIHINDYKVKIIKE